MRGGLTTLPAPRAMWSLWKISILVTTLISALLSMKRLPDNFLSGTGRIIYVNQPVCTVLQTLAWAATTLYHIALTKQHWCSAKAGLAPIKGAVEPSLASSSTLSLSQALMSPGTQGMVTVFPWHSWPGARDSFRSHGYFQWYDGNIQVAVNNDLCIGGPWKWFTTSY